MSRVISDLRYTEGGRYRFVLDADLVVDLRLHLRGFHVLQDRSKTFAVLDDDQLTMRKGYACDGCSPAVRVCGKWFGVPTPRSAVAAAFTHDCLRGYLGLKCLTYSVTDTDRVFGGMLDEEGFGPADIYHAAVSGVFGRLYDKVTRSGPAQASCRCHLPHNLTSSCLLPLSRAAIANTLTAVTA